MNYIPFNSITSGKVLVDVPDDPNLRVTIGYPMFGADYFQVRLRLSDRDASYAVDVPISESSRERNTERVMASYKHMLSKLADRPCQYCGTRFSKEYIDEHEESCNG